MELDSLGEAERAAIERLTPELALHMTICEGAFNLVGGVLQTCPSAPISETPQSRLVCIALMLRLSNDLRTAALLAVRGYPMQALSLTASVYEAAYTIAYIGADDKLAQKWIDHDDPTRSFCGVQKMTRVALERLPGQVSGERRSEAVNQQYRVYRQLCMAKHLNPLLVKQHGCHLRDKYVVSANGPDLSDTAVRGCWFALQHGAFLAVLAMNAFLVDHVLDSQSEALREDINALAAACQELSSRGKARWGALDPFPGKW